MQITPEILSKVLFELDPMRTACKENDCLDEYDSVAAWTVELIENGLAIHVALHQVISEMFFEEMADNVDYDAIKNRLEIERGI